MFDFYRDLDEDLATDNQVILKSLRTVWIDFYAVSATLNCKHELFGVQHRRPLVLALFAPFAIAPPFLALAPEVRAAMHAGNVENRDAFQRDAAEVQSDAVTL